MAGWNVTHTLESLVEKSVPAADHASQLFSVRDLYRLSLTHMQIRQINLPVSQPIIM